MGSARVWSLLLAGTALACAAAETPGDDEPERFRVTDEDGVTVATTLGGALHAGNVFVFEPVLTLRQDPNRTESLLFRPTQITVGPDDHYYVIDRDGENLRRLTRSAGDNTGPAWGPFPR